MKKNISFQELTKYIKQVCPDAIIFESQRDGHILIDTKLTFPKNVNESEELGITLLPLEKV